MKFRNLKRFIIEKKYDTLSYSVSINNLKQGVNFKTMEESVSYIVCYHEDDYIHIGLSWHSSYLVTAITLSDKQGVLLQMHKPQGCNYYAVDIDKSLSGKTYMEKCNSCSRHMRHRICRIQLTREPRRIKYINKLCVRKMRKLLELSKNIKALNEFNDQFQYV